MDSARSSPEAPYDPYIPSNKSTPNPNKTPNLSGSPAIGQDGAPKNDRTAALQSQIDEVTGTMRENINKVSERGAKIDDLQDKTDNLAHSARGFRAGANRVRKKMWWKDMKMRMYLLGGIIILLIVIIVPAVLASKH